MIKMYSLYSQNDERRRQTLHTSPTVTVTEVSSELSMVATAVFAESLAFNADQGSVHCAAILSPWSLQYIAGS